MFSEQAALVAPPSAPVVVENGAGKHIPRYQVEVDMEAMTWGDNMIHVKFQLLIEIADGIAEATRAERVQAYRDLLAGFDELTAFLDRVATVRKDGAICPTVRNVPMGFVKEIMDAIGKAKERQGAPKN